MYGMESVPKAIVQYQTNSHINPCHNHNLNCKLNLKLNSNLISNHNFNFMPFYSVLRNCAIIIGKALMATASVMATVSVHSWAHGLGGETGCSGERGLGAGDNAAQGGSRPPDVGAAPAQWWAAPADDPHPPAAPPQWHHAHPWLIQLHLLVGLTRRLQVKKQFCFYFKIFFSIN